VGVDREGAAPRRAAQPKRRRDDEGLGSQGEPEGGGGGT